MYQGHYYHRHTFEIKEHEKSDEEFCRETDSDFAKLADELKEAKGDLVDIKKLRDGAADYAQRKRFDGWAKDQEEKIRTLQRK